MKKMKKVLACAVAAAMTASLAACGGSGDSAGETAAVSTEAVKANTTEAAGDKVTVIF